MNISLANQRIDQLIIDSSDKIIKPISEYISTVLLKNIGIYDHLKDKSTTNIYYHDNIESTTKLLDDLGKSKISHNRCDIVIEPVFKPSEIDKGIFNFNYDFSTNINLLTDNNKVPLFADSKYNIYLNEYSMPCQINLSFIIKVKSIELADFINSAIYTKYTHSRMHEYNNISYYYNIGNNIIYTMYMLYKLTNTSVKFKEYLKYGSHKNINLSIDKHLVYKNNNIDQFSVNINKDQTFVLSSMEFDIKYPESDKKNKIVDRYTIEFLYKIYFSRPVSISLIYPLIINNVKIPDYLIVDKSSKTNLNIPHKHNDEIIQDNVKVNNYYYTLNKTKLLSKYKTIVFPKEDYILPIKQILSLEHIPIFQGILECIPDIENNYHLNIDIINDIFPLIEPYHDIDALEAIIRRQKDRSKHQYSFINIIFYDATDNVIISKTKIHIDDDLKIRINDVNHQHIYKIIISINTSLKFMDSDIINEAFVQHIYTDEIIYQNLNFLKINNYIEVKKIPNDERDMFFSSDKDNTQYISDISKIDNRVKGTNYGFNQRPFRIGQYLIIPRR